MIQYEILIKGRVQGVGYRHFALQTATNLGVFGWVRNMADDSVVILAQADEAVLKIFIDFLYVGPTRSRVDRITYSPMKILTVFDNFIVKY